MNHLKQCIHKLTASLSLHTEQKISRRTFENSIELEYTFQGQKHRELKEIRKIIALTYIYISDKKREWFGRCAEKCAVGEPFAVLQATLSPNSAPEKAD